MRPGRLGVCGWTGVDPRDKAGTKTRSRVSTGLGRTSKGAVPFVPVRATPVGLHTYWPSPGS